MQVNQTAPVVVRCEVAINAPPEVIWDLLADIDAWPAWNPEVKVARLDGSLAEGVEFHWKTGPSSIDSTVRNVERPSAIGWTGRTTGLAATHVHELRVEGGQTVVSTEESWEGALVSLLRKPARSMLGKSLTLGLQHLKLEAERRAAY
jgi:uncharacterized protein YndB with AHSA1/START domain